jgi:hypothetical protein
MITFHRGFPLEPAKMKSGGLVYEVRLMVNRASAILG